MSATAAQFLTKAARPENKLRLIRLDQTRQYVFRDRGINQRSRVASRGRGEQTDQCFGIDATEQKNQTLSLGGDFPGEIKASGAKLLARQPDAVAVVTDRGRRFKGRDQRKQSAAGEVQIVHCNCGRD